MTTLTSEPAPRAPEDRQYKYAAFISYRHQRPDQDVAAWLVKALETYRVPSRLQVLRKLPARIGRIFRDEEEMPTSASLSDQITGALETSKFLIVVCSPRLKHSAWCREEIRTFHAMRRTDRILPVIVEGEPNDADGPNDPFVPELRDWEYSRRVQGADGREVEERVRFEPIAADLRPKPGESAARRRHVVRLKLLAGLLGCDFEELYERDRRRRRRRTVQWAAAILASLVLVSVLSALAVKRTRDAEWARQVELSQRLAEQSVGSREQADPETRALLALIAHRAAERADQYLPVPQDNRTAVERALRAVAGGDASVVDLRLPDGLNALPPAAARSGGRVAVGAVAGEPDYERMSREAAAVVRGAVFVVTTGRPPRIEHRWTVAGVPLWTRVSDDERRVVAMTNAGDLHMWDLQRPQAPPVTTAAPTLTSAAIAFSTDGRTLAGCTPGGDVSVAPVQAPANAVRFGGGLGAAPAESENRGATLRFSGDGRLLAGSWRRTDAVSVWDVKNPAAAPRRLRCVGLRVAAVYFGTGDQSVLAVSADGAVVRWQLTDADPQPVVEVDGQYTDAVGVANSDVDPAGRRVLIQTISGNDGLVYDLRAPAAPPHILTTPESRTSLMRLTALLGDGRAVTADGNRLRFWTLNAGLLRRPVIRIASMQPGNLKGFNAKSQMSPAMTALVGKMNVGRYWGVGFAPDGKSAYAAALSGVPPLPGIWRWPLDPEPSAEPDVLTRWDASGVAKIAGGLNHAAQWGGRPFDVSGDGRLVAAAWGDGLTLAQTGAAGDPALVRGKGGGTNAVRFKPGPTDQGFTLATADGNGNVIVRTFQPSGAVEERELPAGGKSLRSLAFSPDGRFLAGGDDGGAVRIWATSDFAAPPRLIDAHAARVASLAFANGASTLVTAGGNELKLWDALGGGTVPLATLTTRYDVTCLAPTPDGGRVAIGMSQSPGADLSQTRGIGMLSVLDVGGRRVTSVPEELPGVSQLAISPDGRFLLAACEDLSLHTVILGLPDLLAAAEAGVARNPTREEWAKHVQGVLPYEPVVTDVPLP